MDGNFNGVVVRPLRCINPDQTEYSGLIQMKDETGEDLSEHKFGITSLINKRDLLQKDDCVSFKVDDTTRAVEVNIIMFEFSQKGSKINFLHVILQVTAVRKKNRAVVDSIKGQFGFLDYEVEEAKKLFFHMSEVQGNSCKLFPGDTVEFSIVTNQVNFYTRLINE